MWNKHIGHTKKKDRHEVYIIVVSVLRQIYAGQYATGKR